MGIDDPAVVETALDVGSRHLDTAQIYENEQVVGVGDGQTSADTEPNRFRTVAPYQFAA